MAKILVVEDDSDILTVIVDWLIGDNHQVDSLSNGRQALQQLGVCEYDLLIIDWGLPEVSGIDICKEMRFRGKTLPILMLTGRRDISEKEKGFDSGVDDYLTKPFNPKELSMRVKALLRRQPIMPADQLRLGDLLLEPERHRVSRAGTEIYLQPQEFALLEFLMRHPGQVFNADALLARAWPTDADVSPDNVRICISKLRSKIDEKGQPSQLKTIHGLGYKLDDGKT
jgi:two-component system phosphate regulon response regulator PhoB